jgi:outer membrane protein assembly factor BamB
MNITQRVIALITTTACAAALTATAATASAQAVTTRAAGWPQFQGNVGHTGAELGEKSVTRANASQLSLAWTVPLPSTSSNSEVVVTGGVAYVGSGAMVTAVDAATGTQVWQATLPGALLGTPSVQGGLVVVAFSEVTGRHHRVKGFVAALDSATGATAWIRQVGSLGTPSLGSSTTVTTTADRAYVTLSSGQVEALGLSHGGKIWLSAALPGCSLSQPSVSGALVVVGGGGGYVSALNASDGTVAWTDTLGGGCGSSAANWLPAISGGTVYAGLADGVTALSLTSGAVQWENQSISDVFFPLSVTSNAVIAGSNSGTQLVALSRSDGSVLWQRAVGGQIVGTATFGGLTWGLHQRSGGAEHAVAFGAFGYRVFSSQAFSNSDTQGMPPVVAAGRVYVNLGDELACLALPGSG